MTIRIIRRRRRLVIVSSHPGSGAPSPCRSKITNWNHGMGRRLQAYLDNFRQDFRIMVTLTYGDNAPTSGKTAKAHLRAFFERLRRRGYLAEHSLVWFLEFQARGAAHFHCLGTGFIPKEVIAEAWADITKGDASTCSRVEALRNADAAGKYAHKYAQKSEQKQCPQGFSDLGRMWGVCGSRIFCEEPRQPFVAAAIQKRPEVTERMFFNEVVHGGHLQGVRFVETDNGIVAYGDEESVRSVWQSLLGVASSAALTVSLLGNSPQMIADGWSALREKLESPRRTSRRPSASAYLNGKVLATASG